MNKILIAFAIAANVWVLMALQDRIKSSDIEIKALQRQIKSNDTEIKALRDKLGMNDSRPYTKPNLILPAGY